jgi:hypothetical protein
MSLIVIGSGSANATTKSVEIACACISGSIVLKVSTCLNKVPKFVKGGLWGVDNREAEGIYVILLLVTSEETIYYWMGLVKSF